LSQDSQPIEPQQPFLAEWVTEIFYGNTWYPVRTGSFQRIKTIAGIVYTYEDPFSEESVYIKTDLLGYKFRKPEPEEPRADIIELKKK
jgi:hypothetical protein